MDRSAWLVVLTLFCLGGPLHGCAVEAEESSSQDEACTPVSGEESARVQTAIQNEIDTSKELIAFEAFRDGHEDAVAAAWEQPLYAKYLWTNGRWEHSAATTGTTSFVFEAGSEMTVDVAGEAGVSLHIETPDFSYTLSAEAIDGYPTGDVKSASLGEWGMGHGVSSEIFGSREKVFLRFPGGDWEETQVDDGGTLALTYAMPKVQAKIWTKKSGAMETVEITLNGVNRCASAAGGLKAMFPDVATFLKLN